MTIRGDIEAMLDTHLNPRYETGGPEFINALFDWMISADVLTHMERENVSILEWMAGVDALKEKCAPPVPATRTYDTSPFETGSSLDGDTGIVRRCKACVHYHVPLSPCKGMRLPGSPQSETHGIQAVKRWARKHTHHKIQTLAEYYAGVQDEQAP